MNGSIKVLHIISGTDIGGSEILALNLSRNYSPHSLDIHIIATRNGALTAEFYKSNASFSIIKRNAFLDPILIYRLYRYCRKNKIELIHCHQLLECLNSLFVARFLRIKLFLTFHGYYYFDKNNIVIYLGKLLTRKIDSGIFVSRVLKDYYIEKYNLGNIRSEVIYNGALLPEMNLPDKNSLRREFGLGCNDIIIGMTGNFAPARNHILLCKVFHNLIRNHTYSDRLHLILIGGIDKEPSPKFKEAYNYCLESGLQDRIHFTGPRINASNLLANFDLFVYSTHRETFCLSVAEAILAGVPVLVNDLPVMKEITEDGTLADLYETDNPDDLYIKMAESVLHLEQIKATAKERQKKAIKKYSVQSHQERLIKLYTHQI